MYSIKRYSSWDQSDLKHKKHFCCFHCQQCPLLLPYLEGVTTVALCALTTPEKSTHTPPALLETAVILHGMCDDIVQSYGVL